MRARHLALAVASTVGMFTFGWRLDVLHLRGDELYYAEAAGDILAGRWLTNAQHPPLVKELMALSRHLLGESLLADRLPAALAAWATGLVVAVLVWRVGRPGPWSASVGVLAALLWWVLPFHPGRTATLESLTALFVLAAQLGWVQALTRREPRWLVVGGALSGLAAACKLTGGVALVGLVPAAILLARLRTGRAVLPSLGLAIVASALAWLFPFVPMDGNTLSAMATPVTFQLEHAADGHPVVVGSETYAHPPVWSSLYFFGEALGREAAVGLGLAALLGWGRHPRVGSPIAVSLLTLVLVMSLSPVQLPHYHFVWWPLLLTLAGMALVPTRSGADPGTRTARWSAVALSGVALLTLLPSVPVAATHVARVAQEEATGLGLLEERLRGRVAPEAAVLVWADPRATRAAVPEQELTLRMPESYNPRALLVDPELAERRRHMDLDLWHRCRSAEYTEHDLGEVVLFVRGEDPPADSEPAPGCAALLTG